MYLHLYNWVLDTWEHCFWCPCTISFSKIYHIMGLFRVLLLGSYKWDWVGLDWMDLCVGWLYEHRFAVLIMTWPRRSNDEFSSFIATLKFPLSHHHVRIYWSFKTLIICTMPLTRIQRAKSKINHLKCNSILQALYPTDPLLPCSHSIGMQFLFHGLQSSQWFAILCNPSNKKLEPYYTGMKLSAQIGGFPKAMPYM